MVGYDENKKEVSEFWHGMAGVLSGMATRFLCQPFDVLKIRFQLQNEPTKPGQGSYYWGIVQASKRILQEESYRALWKGHIPAQLLSGVYGLSQFATFEYLTKAVHLNVTDQYKPAVYFICGSLSGAVGTTASLPFDTIRTRLVGQGEPKIYRGVLHAFYTMVTVEGVTSLYKGLAPALLQIMPYAGVQFSAFHFFSKLLARDSLANNENSKEHYFWKNLLAGSAAGLLAKISIYPLDLTKKRLQVQGFEDARKRFGKVRRYDGLVHCLKLTLTEEGVRGLYKGILPSLLKAIVTSGLMFGFYEEILRIVREAQ